MVALVKVLLLAIAQIPLIRAVPTPLLQSLSEEEGKPPDDPSLWLYLGIAAALVLSGGAFAGLTIALMGQVGICIALNCIPQRLTPLGRMKSTYKSSEPLAKRGNRRMPRAC